MPQLGRTEGKVMAGGRYIEGAGAGHYPLLYEGEPPDGALVGAPEGATVVDVTTGDTYTNEGTAGEPDWEPEGGDSAPTVLFADDYAGGAVSEDWDNADAGAGTIAVAADTSLGGTHRLRLIESGGSNPYLDKTIAGEPVLSLRARIRPNDREASQGNPLELWNGATLLARLAFTVAEPGAPGGTWTVTLTYADESSFDSDAVSAGEGDSELCELVYDALGATPTLQFYLDNALAFTLADPTPSGTLDANNVTLLGGLAPGFDFGPVSVADGRQGDD
jgi:hypothetical protein